jgi:tripartite-type tricarboxylate transporter receptor subunit TctC
MMMNRRTFALLAIAAIGLASTAQAQTYPTRPIELIVPFAPGGGTDLSARMIVPFIEKYLKGTIVVINKAGAGGQIGAVAIKNATPDGYTIGFMNVPNTMMKPHERPDAGFTVNDFTPISNMVFDPAVMTAQPDSPFKNLADIVAEAKRRPGRITVGTAGTGSNTHLDMLQLERAAGVKFRHIAYDGGAAPRTALLGGHIELYASCLGDVQRFKNDGTIAILGIMTEGRFPMAPDVPTFAEQGYKILGGAGRGLVGPKGMPQEAVEAIDKAVQQALKDPELIKLTNDIALPLVYMGPKEYGEYLQSSDRELAEAWKETPWIQPKK